MARARRHQAIAELLSEGHVHSQEELRELLAGRGFDVTQATLSRDLKDLGVLKGPGGYVLGAPPAEGAGIEALGRALRRELRAVDSAQHTILLRTDSGHANALAIELDRARLSGVLGTLAGDDTVLVVARTPKVARDVAGRIRSLAG